MRAIDTNVLVRLVARDDPDQIAVAEQFIESGAWVSLLVLAETAWVLDNVYQLSTRDLLHALEMLLDHRKLVFQESEAIAGALDLLRIKPRLGFSDCLIFHLALTSGHVPLGTFDRELAKIKGTVKL